MICNYHMFVYICVHGGSGACTAFTAASQQEGPGFDSRMGRCWLWGAGPPQTSVLRWAISRAFLCGVCMFSPCSQGVFSTKNPNRKNMQNTCPSLTKDGQFTSIGPRALQAAHCSWAVLEEGRSRMGKKQKINSPRPQAYLRVCVCPVSPPYMHVCVPVCRVCHSKKKLKKIFSNV